MPEYTGYYDYRVEVYSGEKLLGIFGYVSNLVFLSLWLKIHFKYTTWDSIRVYHRLSNTYIGTYSRGGDIPAKPKI